MQKLAIASSSLAAFKVSQNPHGLDPLRKQDASWVLNLINKGDCNVMLGSSRDLELSFSSSSSLLECSGFCNPHPVVARINANKL